MSDTLCTVYIDEAGDLGVNRGTQWFVLTAVIVNTANEPQIRQKLATFKTRFNLQTIHFRNLKDFLRRMCIVGALSDENFDIVSVLFDTNQFDKNKMQSEQAYNYICRFLLERVSWLLRDTNRKGKIVLSSRGTARDGELTSYIREKLLPYPSNQIADVFNGVECKTASTWDMLQLADICATSMFYSHEVNGYGFTVPCYAIRLNNKLYKHNGSRIGYGLKYFSADMKPIKGKRPCGLE